MPLCVGVAESVNIINSNKEEPKLPVEEETLFIDSVFLDSIFLFPEI